MIKRKIGALVELKEIEVSVPAEYLEMIDKLVDKGIFLSREIFIRAAIANLLREYSAFLGKKKKE